MTLQLCSLCSGDMDVLCNEWERGLSITLRRFISDQVPLFMRSGIKLTDGSISWQPRVKSPIHRIFPGVLWLCPSWLYRNILCVCVFFLLCSCRKMACECRTKKGESLHLSPCISNPQSNNLTASWAKPNTSCTSCFASRALPVSTHTYIHTWPLSFWKQTHILLNKGLTAALHLAVLVLCLILWLIPLELISLWLQFFFS